ncbi:MAG: hypothetical protein AAFU53_10600, partial [Cyanobacteria bacterium J06632_3]
MSKSGVSESGSVHELMEAVARGEVSPAVAAQKVQGMRDSSPAVEQAVEQPVDQGYEVVGDFAKIDHERTERTGFPEVIWGEDKSAKQIVGIMQAMEKQSAVVMATRVTAEKAVEVQWALPQVTY